MIRFATAAIALGVVLISGSAMAQTAKPKTVEIEGEIGGEPIPFIWFGSSGASFLYMTEITVSLKAGEGLSVTAYVTGDGRTVVASLKDPKGKIIGGSKQREAKSTKFEMGEVNVTGKYTIVIGSDLLGQYRLKVTGGQLEDHSEAVLEAKIKQLKAELAAAEAELKALKEKK